MKNENGFVGVIVAIVVTGLFIWGLWILGCIRFEPSSQIVSGIVYNNANDDYPAGNTTFYVRAGVDTYVDKGNESSFCLPKNSPYIPLVNKAAADKNIKVVVTTQKILQIVDNWATCPANVKVELVK